MFGNPLVVDSGGVVVSGEIFVVESDGVVVSGEIFVVESDGFVIVAVVAFKLLKTNLKSEIKTMLQPIRLPLDI